MVGRTTHVIMMATRKRATRISARKKTRTSVIDPIGGAPGIEFRTAGFAKSKVPTTFKSGISRRIAMVVAGVGLDHWAFRKKNQLQEEASHEKEL